MMNLRFPAAVIAALAGATAAAAAAPTFDGSRPLVCTADRGHDCLPTAYDCKGLQPETSKPPVFNIDFANREVRSPFRTTVLTVTHTHDNSESLVLQGADLLFAWSALINKKSGALTVSIADREGSYVVFGRCRDAAAKPK